MASRAANETVAQYRKIVLNQRSLENEEEKLVRMIDRLDKGEFNDYAEMTDEIDEAAGNAEEWIVNNPRWFSETKESWFRRAVNRAGLDKTKV